MYGNGLQSPGQSIIFGRMIGELRTTVSFTGHRTYRGEADALLRDTVRQLYARGMRSDDLFRLTEGNIRNGRLTYRQRLTGKEVSIPWEPVLREIADRYKREGASRLFPVVTAKDPREQWRQYDCALHRINYNLKKLGEKMGIGYPLNLTVARHSWESMTKGLSISDLL